MKHTKEELLEAKRQIDSTIHKLKETVITLSEKELVNENTLCIREYKSTDCSEIISLFYDTVHGVNAKDYTEEQVNAWATGNEDPDIWNTSFLNHYTLVAMQEGMIVGFGDIDDTGYLDRLYVHKDYQGKGIATVLCDKLEQSVEGNIITHASITAKPFFEKRGYKKMAEQQVKRKDTFLTNYIMEKSR